LCDIYFDLSVFERPIMLTVNNVERTGCASRKK